MLWKPSLSCGRPLRTLLFLTSILATAYYLYPILTRHNVPLRVLSSLELAPPPPPSPPPILPVPPPPPNQPQPSKSLPPPLPCLSLPGLHSIAFIIKTSAAELEQKLPHLLSSTLQCFPHRTIYSDHSETHLDENILDALSDVSPRIKSSHPDFDLYRRLQSGGPDILADEEMWSADNTSQKLDKWKMLPIIHSAFQKYRHDKSWFVFVDMKSHFFQSNLLQWLHSLNSSEPYFFNIQGVRGEAGMVLDSGSFVLSYPAIEAVSAEYQSKKAAYEQLTNERATGHSVLRQIVEKARGRTTTLKMTKSWPMFHPRGPARIDYSEHQFLERMWCYPAVFHEGLNTGEIQELWKWEMQWMEAHPGKIIKHSDVFHEYILPRLVVRAGKVDDWDNLSGEYDWIEKASVEECMPICVERKGCVQYSYKEGKCYFSEKPKMGVGSPGVQSRWLLARVQKFGNDMKECTGEETWNVADP